VGGGVQTGSTQHVSHLLAYCTCPGWLWRWRIWWNEWQGKPKYSEKTCPDATNPTWPHPGLNLGRRGGKPATNCFSYGTALLSALQTLLSSWNLQPSIHARAIFCSKTSSTLSCGEVIQSYTPDMCLISCTQLSYVLHCSCPNTPAPYMMIVFYIPFCYNKLMIYIIFKISVSLQIRVLHVCTNCFSVCAWIYEESYSKFWYLLSWGTVTANSLCWT
jgi:hypothetical protein